MPLSPPPEQHPSRNTRPVWHYLSIVAAAVILVSPLIYMQRADYAVHPAKEGQPGFVGSKKCASCHKAAYDKWQGSHHRKAMAEATEETVLGDFNNTTYTDPHNGVTSRFYMRDGNFFVETEGPDGKLQEFTISHTFGYYPLQQYLIPFPGGRMQCLNIAWDDRQKQWYRLPPYEVEGPGDWLHWTRAGQTWNAMCAECHSTRLEKRFDMASNAYDTRWFEINVGCEACHGPASRHITWAETPAMGRKILADFGLTISTVRDDNDSQINSCAPCHARRYQLGDNLHGEGDLLDTLIPSLPMAGLYYPDGQILEEVYVYGSFTQSKMYMHNVRCSDCHDVHSLKLHKEGNELCLQCHSKKSYDSPSHHFHKKEFEGKPSEGHLCVKCHMPGRHYMGIDYRPDHSLRIPRPDLSAKLDTPNSCSTNDCHGDKPLEWVNKHYRTWYGTSRKPHYGETFAAAYAGEPGIIDELLSLAEDGLVPPIVRATAISLLAGYPGEKSQAVFARSIDNDNSLIRHTAIRHLARIDRKNRIQLLEPKLYDHVRGVRIEAAAALADVAPEELRPENRETFAQVLAEYRKAMEYNSDFAPQRFNLGNLEAATGNHDSAIELYRQALEIDDQFYQAKVNLAMELNRNGKNDEAATLLREVVTEHPGEHEIAYSLGLLLAEMNDYSAAADYLGRAADGMTHYTRPRYNQALALLQLKRYQEGEQALLMALQQEPANLEYFTTLINLYLNFRMTDKAKEAARMVLEAVPHHLQAKELLEKLP